MGFLNKYIASTDPNFWWWNCWLVLWMTSDHSLHLINVILLILCIFSGNHYWFVSWFLFDSSGLLQTEWQSQDLNRNYFTDVFQLTRDKLTPKITSTPFLPHIPTKGRNIQALSSFLMYYTNRTLLRKRTKNRRAQVYLNISWANFQGPEIEDRQVANDIGEKYLLQSLAYIWRTTNILSLGVQLLSIVIHCLVIVMCWATWYCICSAIMLLHFVF